jgi:hypothetical protein
VGVVGSLKRSTPDEIRQMVRTAGGSESVRSRVNAMRAQFIDAEQSPRTLEVLEQIMAAGTAWVTTKTPRSLRNLRRS